MKIRYILIGLIFNAATHQALSSQEKKSSPSLSSGSYYCQERRGCEIEVKKINLKYRITSNQFCDLHRLIELKPFSADKKSLQDEVFSVAAKIENTDYLILRNGQNKNELHCSKMNGFDAKPTIDRTTIFSASQWESPDSKNQRPIDIITKNSSSELNDSLDSDEDSEFWDYESEEPDPSFN